MADCAFLFALLAVGFFGRQRSVSIIKYASHCNRRETGADIFCSSMKKARTITADMHRTIRGIHCADRLPLRGLIREWVDLNTKIAKEWLPDNDVPWWDGERANISVLAGAAWRHSKVNSAVEEYCDHKRKRSRKTGKLKHRNGRVDLYLKLNSQEFIAEAKVCWSRATSRKANPVPEIRKYLRRACSDIKASKPNGQRRLGLVFVVPLVKRKKLAKVDKRLERWVAKVRSIKCDASAWVFPSFAREIGTRSTLYPGVAMLVREV